MIGYIALDKTFGNNFIKFKVDKTFNIKDYPSVSRFEFCQTPMDLMRIYDLDSCRVAEVEIYGASVYLGKGIYGTDELFVVREVDLDTIVSLIYDCVKKDMNLLKERYNCSITDTPFSTASLDKNDGAVWATGQSNISANSGYNGLSCTYRNKSIAASTGDGSKAIALDSQSVAVATGLLSIAKVNKPHSIAIAVGESSIAEATTGCLAVAGQDCSAMGAVGSWLILTEASDNMIDCRAVYVDGKIVKANVPYTLEDGKVVKLS